MKLVYLLLLVVLLQVSIVVASPLIISPTPLDINITTNAQKLIQFNITNPNNYTVYNIKAVGDIVVNPNIVLLSKLDPDTTTFVSLNIKSTHIGDISKIVRLKSLKMASCSSSSTERIVDITTSGFNPSIINICTTDTIRYINLDTMQIKLDILNIFSQQSINTNDVFVTAAFNTEGDYVHQTITSDGTKTGSIVVSDILGEVYDAANDGILNLNLHSYLEETQITPTFPKINFTMGYNEEESSTFMITNAVSESAKNLHISGDWFIFDKNDFTLGEGDITGINFKIVPSQFQLFDTIDTNMTYTKTITISGDNIPTLTQDIQIFINYADVESTNVSSYAWWQARKEFCDAYPDSTLCLSEPRIVEVYVANDSIPVEFNMTGKQLGEYLNEVRGLKALWTEYSNVFKLDTDAIKTNQEGNTNRTQAILENQEKDEKRASSFRGSFYLIFGTFMFLILGGIAYYILNKYWERNKSRRETDI